MEYKYICWCKEDNHDKIWGIILIEKNVESTGSNKYLTVWGKRGAKIQTKLWKGDQHVATTLYNNKIKKGYMSVDINHLHTVYPEFQRDLEKTTIWSILRG